MSKLNNLITNIENKGKNSREWLTLHSEGKTVFRICPDIEDEEQAPFEIVYLHSGFTHPFYKKRANVPCLRTNRCPMCIEAEKIKRQSFSDYWKYKATPYFIYNVVDRLDGKLKLLKASFLAHEAIIRKIKESANEGLNPMSIEYGRDIEMVVRSVNNKLNYKAYVLPEKETKPFPGKVLEELRLVKPLSESYKRYSIQEIQDIVDGKVTDYKNKKNEDTKRFSKKNLMENLSKKMGIDVKKEEDSESLDLFKTSEEQNG